MRRAKPVSSSNNAGLFLGIGAFVLFILVAILGNSFKVVEDGEAGIRITLGNIGDQPLGAGIHFKLVGIQEIEIMNVKTQEIKEVARVPSSEGLISEIDVSVIYKIPADNAPKIRKEVGIGFRDTVLVPYMREAIRGVASGYQVKALFNDTERAEIGDRIKQILIRRLEPRGITIEDVLLRDVKLPPTFLQSIEAKLRSEQESLQKEFELQKAKKDAEIEVARARGAAEANKIIAESLDPAYIQYLWVQGLQDGSSEVIYVPTEANLPVLESVRQLMPRQ